jgi:RNA polymerase sigma factor (sigma-70 family)
VAAPQPGSRASRDVDDLYRRHGAEVYRYAYAMLGNRADAEDVTQTTFVNALRALEQGQSPRQASSWLYAIAHNIVRQRFRQARSRPSEVELYDEIPGAAPAVDDEAPTLASVVAALGRIPPTQREALVLREFEGRPYAEIAEILGITTGALETLLFRARRSLAEELENLVTCDQAEQLISRALDRRLSRKERKRLEAHMRDCPSCARFELVQKRGRRALRGLALVPIPASLTLLKGTNSAAAASLPTIGAATAATVTATTGGGAATTGGLLAGGLAAKAAAVVVAAGVAGGVGYTGAHELRGTGDPEHAPRSTVVRPATPPGLAKGAGGVHRGRIVRAQPVASAAERAHTRRNSSPSAAAPGQVKHQSSSAGVGNSRAVSAPGKVKAKPAGKPKPKVTRTQPTKRPNATSSRPPTAKTKPHTSGGRGKPTTTGTVTAHGKGAGVGRPTTSSARASKEKPSRGR